MSDQTTGTVPPAPQAETCPTETTSPQFLSYGDNITLNVNDNYHPRCPVAFILDVSGSMFGEPIAELNKALPGLFQDLLTSDLTAARVEPCLITCGGEAKLLHPFAPLRTLESFQPNLQADGETPLGGAINLALQEIKARQAEYRAKFLPSYVPAVVILTDGKPTDYEWGQASAQLGQLAKQEGKGWTVIVIAIGRHADVETLKLVTSPSLPPLRLQGLKFSELFAWLSQSLRIGTSRAPSALNSSGVVLPPASGCVQPT